MRKRIALPIAALGASLVWFVRERTRGRGSLAMRAATLVLKAGGKPLADVDASREAVTSRTYPAPAAMTGSLAKKVAVVEATVRGYTAVTLTPKAGASRWHVIYYHGGGYVNDLIRPHWDIVEALIDATGATVTVPLYPLAPEHSHREAFPFLTDVYRRVIARSAPADVVLAGDSAGGGLVLGRAIENLRLGLPMPARLILFSPWLDLSLADPAARTVEPEDVMLSVDALRLYGTMWAGGDDPHLPRLSPLYADLARLPPIDLYQGTRDIFVVDARTFVRKVTLAGGTIRYREFPGAFHVFVGATFTPEAKTVFREIGAGLPKIAPAGC